MLQPSIRAILIRAAMEVLALRRDKAISALVALITKEQLVIVGIIMFLVSVCRNCHTNCVMLCRCR